MKQFFITIAGVFAGLMLFFVIVPMVFLAAIVVSARPRPLAPRSILVLDLRAPLTDQTPRNPLALFTGRSLSVLGIEETLRAAEKDSRVGGLLVRLPEGGTEPAAADELSLAFKDFRAHGKPILVHSQGIYAAGMAPSTYELAAASGDIWMQPGSSFQVTGLAREEIFFHDFFRRHAVVPDFQQRYEYKTAINPYLYDDFTSAQRLSDLSWMGSIYDTATGEAAGDRGRAPLALRSVLEAGPYTAEEARAKGLVDSVGDLRGAEQTILAKAGRGATLVEFGDYDGRTRFQARSGGFAGDPTVAVITAEGVIMTGKDGVDNPFEGERAIRSDKVSRAFYRAIDDSAVKAIVFRVSSPGGSDTASEQILAAVRAAKAAGKPVVVSMGTYGASGGYWIACQASRIIAEPSTITGSIGVFGGKFALGEALGKFGVNMRGLKVGGDFSDAYSARGPMTPSQRAAFSALVDRIYDGFIGRVASGRRLPIERVQQIARGRVWTGVQAKELGLVDELGGFYLAVDRAKALAGIKGPARLEGFDVETSPFETLQHALGVSAQTVRVLSAVAWLAQDPTARSTIEAAQQARLRSQGATVLAPIGY
jgi:protease-4